MKYKIYLTLLYLMLLGNTKAQEITIYDHASIQKIGYLETSNQYLIQYENYDLEIIDSIGNKIQTLSGSNNYNFKIHETKNTVFVVDGSSIDFISNGETIKNYYPDFINSCFPLYDTMLLAFFRTGNIKILSPHGYNNLNQIKLDNIIAVVGDSLIYENINNSHINEYRLTIYQNNYKLTLNRSIKYDRFNNAIFFTNSDYPYTDLYMHWSSFDSAGLITCDSIYILDQNKWKYYANNNSKYKSTQDSISKSQHENRVYSVMNNSLYYRSILGNSIEPVDSIKYYVWNNRSWQIVYETQYSSRHLLEQSESLTSYSFPQLILDKSNNKIGFTNGFNKTFLEIKEYNKSTSLFTESTGNYYNKSTIFSAFSNQYLIVPYSNTLNQQNSFLLLDKNDRKPITSSKIHNGHEYDFSCYNSDTTLLVTKTDLTGPILYKLYQHNNNFIVDTLHLSHIANSTGLKIHTQPDFRTSWGDLIKVSDTLYLGNTIHDYMFTVNPKTKKYIGSISIFPSFINESYEIINYHNTNKDEFCILISDGSKQYIFHGSSNKVSYFNFDNFTIYSAFKYDNDFFLVYNKGICKINSINGNMDYFSNANLPDFPFELDNDAQLTIYNNDSLIFIASGLAGTNDVFYFDLKSNNWDRIQLTPPHGNILQLKYANGVLYTHTANTNYNYTKSFINYSKIKNPTFNDVNDISFNGNQINPCSGNCIILNSKFQYLKVFDQSSKLILHAYVDYDNYTLNTHNLANGIYIVELFSPNDMMKETKILMVSN